MFSLLSFAFCVPSALAWGKDGHAAVAQIASNLMSKRAVELTEENIGGGQKMTDIASWADTVRYEDESFAWSAGLHFVNVPTHTAVYDYARDCGRQDFLCVISAMTNYTMRATPGGNLSEEEISQATKFLVHFMADSHQPMHMGWEGDQGGNKITVMANFLEPAKEYNLHKIWDTILIDQRKEELQSTQMLRALSSHAEFDAGWYKMVDEIMARINGGEYTELVEAWTLPCQAGIAYCGDFVAQQAVESAVQKAYRNVDGSLVEDGGSLDRDYFVDRMNTVYFQLAKAGARLAYVLEHIVFAETEAEMTCPAADAKCQIDSNDAGSYCKYYQKGPGGSVCQGSNLPCHCNPAL